MAAREDSIFVSGACAIVDDPMPIHLLATLNGLKRFKKEHTVYFVILCITIFHLYMFMNK